MKKVTFCIGFICMFFVSCAQDVNVVGKIENAKPVLTANTVLICKTLSKNLALASNIKEDFKSVELIRLDTFYLLVFHGSKYKTTFRAKVENTNIVVNPKASCTTSDKNCVKDPNACVPTSGQGCACTGCPTNATCTKTCSSVSLLKQ